MTVGVSGVCLYVPPHRVSLESWCDWTGANWDKVQAVVGRSFRVKGPGHSLYTMAASAVLQLIEKYDVDPGDVGMLVLGTESSTDNAAGAVIVRGMVDEGLEAKGMPRLARDIEVPEVKHACLGGIYGMKQSLRYLSVDGRGRKAIVVSADIAEYERGSTGEPTQGAGAVAMLLEEDPKLLSIDLTRAASASSYRGPDFRKPFGRFLEPSYAHGVERVHDFPVFNGKYSTACYLDEVLSALDSMFVKAGNQDRVAYHHAVDRVFFHRPYRRITETAWALSYLAALSGSDEHRGALEELCTKADVDPERMMAEIAAGRDLFASVKDGQLPDDPFPQTMRVIRALRSTDAHKDLVHAKLELGSEPMMELGNVYTASLPAWIAAALDEAATRDDVKPGEEWLLVGYGSGNAAEAIPATLAQDFRAAAKKIDFASALENPIDLDQSQYEAIHDGRTVSVEAGVQNGFVVYRIGVPNNPAFDEVGIEYYRFVP